MNKLDFLDKFEKELEDIEGVSIGAQPPRYSYDTGNYALNYITNGTVYTGGIAAQGRIGILAGPSGVGKSFLCANVMREAQKQGAFILLLDSENASDSNYLSKIGVNTEDNFMYIGVTTIQQVTNIVSQFLKKYKQEHGDSPDAPQVMIVLDSCSMLLTDTESEHYEAGVQKGDQGNRNRTLKHMLKTFVQDIKPLNVAMVATSHVYKSQDMYSQDPWVIPDAIKYSASTITLLTKSKLKDKQAGGEVTGIKMKCEGYKIRYGRPFQTVVIDVPYNKGYDKTSCLIEIAQSVGAVERTGPRYRIIGETDSWFEKNIETVVDRLLPVIEQKKHTFVKISEDEKEDDE